MSAQQGGGGIMFLARIINNEMVGPFGVKEGVKITAETFLKEFLLPWYKKKSLSFRKKMIFIHDNAPPHAARLTLGLLKKSLAKKWHNHGMASIFSLILIRLRISGASSNAKFTRMAKQFSSKDELWNVIQAAAKDISADEDSKFTSSMDRRLIAFVTNHGANNFFVFT